VTMLPMRLGRSAMFMLATMLPSHAGNDAVGVTWPWCDEDVESCWR
jgi:hypothetical protein